MYRSREAGTRRAVARKSGSRSRKQAPTMTARSCGSRLAKLVGGVAVIRVSGATNEAQGSPRWRGARDPRGAQEGVVPGGGAALLYAI